MDKSIPIELNPSRAIEVDGALVARGLGLAVEDFRQLMEHRKITVLCERGTGEDAGLYRASFYYGSKRVRLVMDGNGILVGENRPVGREKSPAGGVPDASDGQGFASPGK